MLKTLILATLTMLQIESPPILSGVETVVFNHIQNEAIELDKVVHNLLAKKFNVLDIHGDERHYIPPILREGDMPKAPVTSDGNALSGYVLIIYVITEDGRAAHAMSVTETDPRLTAAALQSMNGWRFRAGLLDGKPVAMTAAQEFEF